MSKIVDVIIPAYNEEEAISKVVGPIPKNAVRLIVVVDNGSSDLTSENASKSGATVVRENARGYGNACLRGIEFLKNQEPRADVVVFLDGDFSDDPTQLPEIIEPILNEKADLVIGSRSLGKLEKGAMTGPQRFGNWLAPLLIRIFWGQKFTDLGPFRAITFEKLEAMKMADRDFGWTVEMQVKAAKMKMRCSEVPMNYRKRGGGKSKVSGTIRGSYLAGKKILWTIAKSLFE